ncbi:MAG: hypothetical protein JWR19_4519, partial [Pedosphaera sp.]|nr:hypothetical protein [Pedosphaera sp.]
KNHFFFPGRLKDSGVSVFKSALGQGLRRACKSLDIKPDRTPHGLRSYYVTKRRSDGATDREVAAEIGDKTVSLIQDTYGDIPENWRGGKKLSWLPKEGLPAWRRWDPPENKIIDIKSGLKSGLKAKSAIQRSHANRC